MIVRLPNALAVSDEDASVDLNSLVLFVKTVLMPLHSECVDQEEWSVSISHCFSPSGLLEQTSGISEVKRQLPLKRMVYFLYFNHG